MIAPLSSHCSYPDCSISGCIQTAIKWVGVAGLVASAALAAFTLVPLEVCATFAVISLMLITYPCCRSLSCLLTGIFLGAHAGTA